LKDLAKSFNTNLQKLEFNHNLINESNLLKYKDEVIKYCINDSVLLYNIIKIFNEQIYSNFQVGLSSSPTLPSLSFRIYRTHYMNTHIPIINGHVYNDLYKAYYGDHVDMYIPGMDLLLIAYTIFI
jgi:DNA polymerase type B, organellar and viral